MQIATSSLSNRAVRSTLSAAVICRVSGVGAVKVANCGSLPMLGFSVGVSARLLRDGSGGSGVGRVGVGTHCTSASSASMPQLAPTYASAFSALSYTELR